MFNTQLGGGTARICMLVWVHSPWLILRSECDVGWLTQFLKMSRCHTMSQAPTQQGVGGTHTELSGFGLKKSTDEVGTNRNWKGRHNAFKLPEWHKERKKSISNMIQFYETVSFHQIHRETHWVVLSNSVHDPVKVGQSSGNYEKLWLRNEKRNQHNVPPQR